MNYIEYFIQNNIRTMMMIIKSFFIEDSYQRFGYRLIYPMTTINSVEWLLIFKVLDTENDQYIRDEVKKSFDELPLLNMIGKYKTKCNLMNWTEPRYKITLEVKKRKN